MRKQKIMNETINGRAPGRKANAWMKRAKGRGIYEAGQTLGGMA